MYAIHYSPTEGRGYIIMLITEHPSS
jgi:hypothetical protein